jgi:membrane-bound lytic murein transglycosylase D
LGRSKNQCELCPQILKSISESKIKIPKNTKDKKLFFKERADSLRFQTGQRDMIAKGLHLSAPFFDKIYELIELYEIPSELLALAFLESSFNTNARSRAGATGVWQFMKVTGHHFMIVTPKNDHRLNPLLSTLAAFQLLKQSRKILGRWDLAVWSYNSGTPAVLNAQKKHGGSSMTLADMLQNYESERIRFASTNFYSSFLALVHALTYRYYLFPDELPDNNKIDAKNLKFYVSLCSFRPNWFFSLLEKTSPNIRDLNSHLRKRYRNTKYPRGTILISDRDLTKGRYYKLPKENYTNRYTKNWRLLIKGMKCNP